MIESIHFQNFKALQNTTLPLGQFTLIVGPNGSGKSTALQALRAVACPANLELGSIATAGIGPDAQVSVVVRWGTPDVHIESSAFWTRNRDQTKKRANHHHHSGKVVEADISKMLQTVLESIRVYSFHANALAAPVTLQPEMELQEDGGQLAGVLDRLQDQAPERFEALNDELGRWLPEFNRVLFEMPSRGMKSLALRMRKGNHRIPARELSQGTLVALAILTLTHLFNPPAVLCLEEPDHGIHPRLLRDVRDAIYRLTYPESVGETRAPVQVIATTHSPYFLDLFKDHPEEIVIAQKVGQEAKFERLSDLPNIDEILQDSHLGDAWYSGILGGVPCEQ